MKKLINAPRTAGHEMLEGLEDVHSGLAILDAENVIPRANLPRPSERAVAVLSPPCCYRGAAR